MAVTKQQKADILKKFKTGDMDTGSPEVQVALLDHFLHGIVTLKGNKMISKYTLNTK